jgi:hypothetical protein
MCCPGYKGKKVAEAQTLRAAACKLGIVWFPTTTPRASGTVVCPSYQVSAQVRDFFGAFCVPTQAVARDTDALAP